MKVESLRIQSKKRKQSQRIDGGATNSGSAGTGKSGKRSYPSSFGGEDNGGKTGSAQYMPGCSSGADSQAMSSTGSTPGGSRDSKEGKDGNSQQQNRRRFVWSVPLHQDFVAAVFDIGLKCASPKLLLEMMPVVDGLTSEHIKSHLQKYRLHRQRSREEFLKSYGYLTDLDGGKGLGGGSAVATIKAAAAAAGDIKGPVTPCISDSGPEEVGCSSSCGCVDAPTAPASGLSDVAAGDSASGGADESVETKDAPNGVADGAEGVTESKCLPKTATGPVRPGEGTEGDGSDTNGQQLKPDAKAAAAVVAAATTTTTMKGAEMRTDMNETLTQLQPQQQQQQQGNRGPVQVVTSALLHSHLELLSRGIDMQIKFHQHLREVVESQRTLQLQLLGKMGSGHLPPPYPREVAGNAKVMTSTGEMKAPAAIGIRSVNPSAGGGRELPRESRAVNDVGRAFLEGGRRQMGGPMKPVAAPQKAGAIVGGSRGSGVPAVPGVRTESTAEVVRRRGLPPGESVEKMKAEAPKAGSATNTAAGAHASSGAQERVPDRPELRQGKEGGPVETMSQTPASLRVAFSVHDRAGASLPATSLSVGRRAAGMAQRGYIPGEYTLSSKSSETAATGASHARGPAGCTGMVGGGHPGVLVGRGTADAHAAFAATGLAPATATGTSGNDTLALQRHMQAQMEMQRTMLEACVDQATHFGAHRAWCGAGGVPVQGAVGGGGGGEAAGGNVGSSGGGGGGGGVGEVGSAGLGSKGERTDALSLQPPDAGEAPALMGLLQDDVFDFNWLDRDGELKQGDAPAPARPAGEDQSLFSFLME